MTIQAKSLEQSWIEESHREYWKRSPLLQYHSDCSQRVLCKVECRKWKATVVKLNTVLKFLVGNSLERLVPIFDKEELFATTQLRQLSIPMLQSIGIPLGVAINFIQAVKAEISQERWIKEAGISPSRIELPGNPRQGKQQTIITRVIRFPENNPVISVGDTMALAAEIDGNEKTKLKPKLQSQTGLLKKPCSAVQAPIRDKQWKTGLNHDPKSKPRALDSAAVKFQAANVSIRKARKQRLSQLSSVYSVREQFAAPKTMNPFAKLEK